MLKNILFLSLIFLLSQTHKRLHDQSNNNFVIKFKNLEFKLTNCILDTKSIKLKNIGLLK